MNAADLDQFIQFTSDVILHSQQSRITNPGDLIGAEASILQLDMLHRMLQDLLLYAPVPEQPFLTQLIPHIHTEQEALGNIVGETEDCFPARFDISVQYTGRRPKVIIDEQDLRMLKLERFSTREISELLGVSERTVKRRCQEYGLTDQTKYSEISDAELDREVTEVVGNFPSMGYRLIWDNLASAGLLVQRERIWSSLHRVDPFGIAQRWSQLIPRRKYNVHGPNALWHIDGNHKLIRWGFVVHGGIDGYTRMIVFLKCSTNNRAETVLRGFQSAIQTFGCPARVRTDHGGENIDVGRQMLQIYGEHSRCFLTGPSTHNQRIERLWRDLNRVAIKLFRCIFTAMENEGILDVSNRLHLLILQYVFLHRIQQNLEIFIRTWNSHKLSSEGMKTPRQLWILGANERGVLGTSADMAHAHVDEFYGVDPDGPVVLENPEAVEVNDIFPDFLDELRFLQSHLNPNIDDGNFGINLFIMGKGLLGAI